VEIIVYCCAHRSHMPRLRVRQERLEKEWTKQRPTQVNKNYIVFAYYMYARVCCELQVLLCSFQAIGSLILLFGKLFILINFRLESDEAPSFIVSKLNYKWCNLCFGN
jgi:hypothetical protein